MNSVRVRRRDRARRRRRLHRTPGRSRSTDHGAHADRPDVDVRRGPVGFDRARRGAGRNDEHAPRGSAPRSRGSRTQRRQLRLRERGVEDRCVWPDRRRLGRCRQPSHAVHRSAPGRADAHDRSAGSPAPTLPDVPTPSLAPPPVRPAPVIVRPSPSLVLPEAPSAFVQHESGLYLPR